MIDDDYYTAKYAATDGALLWERRYDSPTHGNDFVGSRGLAIGPDGTIAVTGSSGGDVTTVVFREHLRALSIERAPGGVRIRMPVVGGLHYELQRATSLTGPWSTVTSLSPEVNGMAEYVDSPVNVAAAFYRLANVP